MREPPPYPAGAVLGGKYRLDRLLGQGGMGAVYLGENVDIGRPVAVKVLLPQFASDPDMLARFRQEARAAAAIGHPGIVQVLDMGTLPEGGAYLVMEHLEGQTLGERIARGGPLDASSAGYIVAEVLSAIAAAHAKGVIHRDLKPDNVFLVERPRREVKLLDFGISKFRAHADAGLTRTGVVMGTPAYMAPEQARGAKDVGPQADLYAVGAILYEALAGTPAFGGDSYNEVLAKVLTEPPRPLLGLRPGVPVPLAGLIDRLLAKSPADRPADAEEVRGWLLQALGSAPTPPPLAPLQTVAPQAPRPILEATAVRGATPPPLGPQAMPTPQPGLGPPPLSAQPTPHPGIQVPPGQPLAGMSQPVTALPALSPVVPAAQPVLGTNGLPGAIPPLPAAVPPLPTQEPRTRWPLFVVLGVLAVGAFGALALVHRAKRAIEDLPKAFEGATVTVDHESGELKVEKDGETRLAVGHAPDGGVGFHAKLKVDRKAPPSAGAPGASPKAGHQPGGPALPIPAGWVPAGLPTDSHGVPVLPAVPMPPSMPNLPMPPAEFEVPELPDLEEPPDPSLFQDPVDEAGE